jgi:hypothetical protein
MLSERLLFSRQRLAAVGSPTRALCFDQRDGLDVLLNFIAKQQFNDSPALDSNVVMHDA